ncbi:ABC transporter permease [Chitinophaga pendula]|uniref:ABC transporter permease n=1 Tax=Chitinophaga TaxID=79328 RepID=UPI000BAF226C|nr:MULTISPECIES: ABC transporter permease [Chitinophaga]ASZ11674.1 hypothetical protein CK934_12235 [Chitinophaga sp. MD30]UCJ05313.1 ABC transporter permease [Chitinophaga pendula]
MLLSYIKITWRNLWRTKIFSAINIIGLSIGCACSLLILLCVQDELQINTFHTNREHLYAVVQSEYAEGKVWTGYSTPAPLAEELKKNRPDVSMASGFSYDRSLFSTTHTSMREEGAFANNDFLRMFSFPILEGNPAQTLNTPNSIALSKKMAIAFFGTVPAALGQTIKHNNKEDYTVTAIFDDPPATSSLRFNYLLNWQTFIRQTDWATSWASTGVRTYLLLNKHTEIPNFRSNIRKFLDHYYINQGPGLREELDIQRFDKQYLYNNFTNGKVSGGRIDYVILFSIVATFVLIIACINFINLSTARAMKRAKEIGVRKTAGAGKSNLVRQFISEALLLSFIAIIFALGLVQLLLPAFNSITGKAIIIPLDQPYCWLQLFLLGTFTGLLAGSYPAFYLASFEPIKILRGTLRPGNREQHLRKALVVCQFILSTLLVVGTITISSQVKYISEKNLGYDRKNLLTIPIEGNLATQYDYFKQQIQQIPGIQSVTLMTDSPVEINGSQDDVKWKGKPNNFRPTFEVVNVQHDFTTTMNIQLLTGRDFSHTYPADSANVLLNEAAVKKMELKDPIGQQITLENESHPKTIIGIVKDFNTGSLHQNINPLIITLGNKGWGNIVIRTSPDHTPQVLTALENVCKKINPAYPFLYRLADQEYQQLYTSEKIIQTLTKQFACMAILISCLGLLGLAQFTTEQRRREISIRKVLGASIIQIVRLLSLELLLLTMIAFIIATPLAWWIIRNWLNDYAYHINPSWQIFALAGTISIVIAFITVGSLTVKAATDNPARHLNET